MNAETATKIANGFANAEHRLDTAKANMAAQLQDGNAWGSDRYAHSLQEIAEEIGKVSAWSTAHLIVKNLNDINRTDDDTVVQETIRVELTEGLLRTDDGWSGRTNDARRSEADGFRFAVNAIFRMTNHR